MPIKDESLQSIGGRKHPVPQNVMDVEFKIVGDLTIRQFMYLVVGALLVYIFYKSDLPAFWRWIIMILTGGTSIAVAFIPIEDRGLDVWLVNFVKSITIPSQRIWKKSYSTPAYFLSDYASIIKSEILTLTPTKSRNKLDEYLGHLPRELTKIDISEKQKIKDITELMSSAPSAAVRSKVIKKPPPSLTEIQQADLESKKDLLKSLDLDKKAPKGLSFIDRPIMNIPSQLRGEIKIDTKTKLPSTIAFKDLKDIKKEERLLNEKIKDLLSTAHKAKIQFAQQQSKEHKVNRLNFIHTKLKELTQERNKLASKIGEKRSTLGKIQGRDQKVSFEKQIKGLKTMNTELKEKLKKVQKEIDKLKHKEQAQEKLVKPAQPKKDKKEQIDTNVISGVAKGKDGSLLENAVVIIKDNQGDVISALKTNKLGQFQTQTPIPNGRFTIEVIKGGEKFDIISVELTGELVKPVTIIGKE